MELEYKKYGSFTEEENIEARNIFSLNDSDATVLKNWNYRIDKYYTLKKYIQSLYNNYFKTTVTVKFESIEEFVLYFHKSYELASFVKDETYIYFIRMYDGMYDVVKIDYVNTKPIKPVGGG